MKALLACAAISVVIASAAVTVTALGANSADAQPTANASYYEPLPAIAKTLKGIAKSNGAILSEVKTLNQSIGSAGFGPNLLTEVKAIHTNVGNSAGIFNILDELQAIRNALR